MTEGRERRPRASRPSLTAVLEEVDALAEEECSLSAELDLGDWLRVSAC